MQDITFYKKEIKTETGLLRKEELEKLFSNLAKLKGDHLKVDKASYDFKGKPNFKSSFYGNFQLEYTGNSITMKHQGMVKSITILLMAIAIAAQVIIIYFTGGFDDLPFLPGGFAAFEVLFFSLMFFLNARVAVKKNMTAIDEALQSIETKEKSGEIAFS